jgi:hypothetical protein
MVALQDRDGNQATYRGTTGTSFLLMKKKTLRMRSLTQWRGDLAAMAAVLLAMVVDGRHGWELGMRLERDGRYGGAAAVLGCFLRSGILRLHSPVSSSCRMVVPIFLPSSCRKHLFIPFLYKIVVLI